MVLVNGADGIGTGWSTKIPNYDVREIVANIRRMLEGLEPQTMVSSALCICAGLIVSLEIIFIMSIVRLILLVML